VNAALFSAVVLVVFYVVVFYAVHPRMPLLLQRLVGVSNAMLAMLVAIFAAGEIRKRRPSAEKRRITLLGQIVGLIVFVLVLAWWLSPWAPIKVVRTPAATPSATPAATPPLDSGS
jgi:hypothetical protein